MNKLFIVAPFFPPSPAPPSQRVRLLVRHCVTFGFYPTVFTVDPKYREEIKDEWMVKLVGNDFDEIRINCFDQKKTRKFGFGDLGLRLLPFLFIALRKEIKKKRPSFILYPVPSWYVLILAPIIKKLTGVKYGIDFIDPWVYKLPDNESVFKQRMSQKVAILLENWVTKNADIIFSVSEGINSDLCKRHKHLKNKPMFAVPYGADCADFADFKSNLSLRQNGKTNIRYIGAVWNDCYPVLDGLMPSLAAVNCVSPIQLEFFGTSYAGEGLAIKQLDRWIAQHNMKEYTNEHCLRVAYKFAVELTMSADILLLFGGMQPYYAASKLMGLIVSGKPFVAFLHVDSYPADVLKKIDYKYLVTYSSQEGDLPSDKVALLKDTFLKLIKNKDSFISVDINNAVIREHTAESMSKNILEKISLILEK